MIKRVLAAGFVVAAATAPAMVGAHDQLAECNGVVTPYDVGGQIVYTDDRGPEEDGLPTVPGVTGAYWVYLESNGHEGLQSGGDHALLGETPTFTDTCVNREGPHKDLPGDSILF